MRQVNAVSAVMKRGDEAVVFEVWRKGNTAQMASKPSVLWSCAHACRGETRPARPLLSMYFYRRYIVDPLGIHEASQRSLTYDIDRDELFDRDCA